MKQRQLLDHRNVYVWRKDEEQLRPECYGVHPDSEHPARASTMFGALFGFHGVDINSPQSQITLIQTSIYPYQMIIYSM